MCGILGCVAQRIGAGHFEQALARLEHRGPFARGQVVEGQLRLGMTRLPMSNNQEYSLPPRVAGWLASYNGEVYRATESGLLGEIDLLIQAIAHRSSFPDGMYAFAMLDPAGSRLYLGRDALGIKPLYYWHDAPSGEFAFASELPALLQLLGPQPLDQDALADIVATGVVLEYRTMFQGIRLLPPGTLLSWDINQPRQAPQLQPLRLEGTPIEAGLEACLGRSISHCTDTFRDVGLLLSGGIDSNLINSFLPRDTAKFHVAVSDSHDHPGSSAELHTCYVASSDFWGLLQRAVSNFAVPSRMSSILMYQRMAEQVRSHGYYCVLLGEGADELFWGYPRHLAVAEQLFTSTPDQLAGQYFGDVVSKSRWLAPQAAASVLARVHDVATDLCSDGIDEAIWRFDLHYSLEPLLRRADHLLMSQTIEARLPFLHHGLPLLARGIGRQRLAGLHQKAPLQDLIRHRLPSYVVKKKNHFRLPFSCWHGVVDEMRGFLVQRLDVLHALGLSRLMPETVAGMEASDAFTLTTLLLWQQTFAEHVQ